MNIKAIRLFKSQEIPNVAVTDSIIRGAKVSFESNNLGVVLHFEEKDPCFIPWANIASCQLERQEKKAKS